MKEVILRWNPVLLHLPYYSLYLKLYALIEHPNPIPVLALNFSVEDLSLASGQHVIYSLPPTNSEILLSFPVLKVKIWYGVFFISCIFPIDRGKIHLWLSLVLQSSLLTLLLVFFPLEASTLFSAVSRGAITHLIYNLWSLVSVSGTTTGIQSVF